MTNKIGPDIPPESSLSSLCSCLATALTTLYLGAKLHDRYPILDCTPWRLRHVCLAAWNIVGNQCVLLNTAGVPPKKRKKEEVGKKIRKKWKRKRPGGSRTFQTITYIHENLSFLFKDFWDPSANILSQMLSLIHSQFSKSTFLFHWASQLYSFARLP